MLMILLFAAADHLPEVPDDDADPDPGSAAVRCASVPDSRGTTNLITTFIHMRRRRGGILSGLIATMFACGSISVV